MKPGAIILNMLRGEEQPPEHTYDGMRFIPAQEYEWMFWRNKRKWFDFENSTIDKPTMVVLQCTTLDLLEYLYEQKSDTETVTMVIVKLFKNGDVIDSVEFFV